MSYFQLAAPVKPRGYSFDYHSHLGGILPVRAADQKPSLAAWLTPGDWANVHDGLDARELALFDQALQFMRLANPFVSASLDTPAYSRVECVAENIYIAMVLLADYFSLPAFDDWDIVDPRLYAAVSRALKLFALKPKPPAPEQGGPSTEAKEWISSFVRYFNGKFYSGNKYTPFDDVYSIRSNLVDRVHAEPDVGEARYQDWLVATLDHLRVDGVAHIQIAASPSDIPALDALMVGYNEKYATAYRALAHTPMAYQDKDKLLKDLESRVLPCLCDPKFKATIGLDILGTENKVADYVELMKFLNDPKIIQALAKNFGAAPTSRAPRMVVHIHSGEGAGTALDNRSLIGYYLASGARRPDAAFFLALREYILRCARTTLGRQRDEPRGSAGARARRRNGVSGLFDELFRYNSLSYQGCQLRRYDINGERSRQLVAYHGKRSVMALTEAFEQTIDNSANGPSFYDLLAVQQPIYIFRLGHDYYYRSFMAAKFPLLGFDTNLGSNAITGAAGLFDSLEAYRINRGFRHLDGYIDTDVLIEAGTALLGLPRDVLSQAQAAFFLALAKNKPATLAELLGDPDSKEAAGISDFLTKALGQIAGDAMTRRADYQRFVALAKSAGTDNELLESRYQALVRTFALFCNWRSFLLGADGQGVEHSKVQDEFLRMVILLAYRLLPNGERELPAEMVDQLQQWVIEVAERYWRLTVGDIAKAQFSPAMQLQGLQGFRSPGSVVTVRRTPI